MRKKAAGEVGIAKFKARLSRYLGDVRRGHPVTLMDRDTPVARVLPYPGAPGKLVIRKPIREPGQVRFPGPLRKEVDGVRLLLEDRRASR